MRDIGATAILIAGLFIVSSRRHRRAIARKLAEARSIVSRRFTDVEARSRSRALDTWEGEGGATRDARARDTNVSGEAKSAR